MRSSALAIGLLFGVLLAPPARAQSVTSFGQESSSTSHPGRGMKITGITMTAVGGAMLSAGSMAIVFAPTTVMHSDCVAPPCPGPAAHRDFGVLLTGLIVGGTGIAMAGVGIPLWIAGATAESDANVALDLKPGMASLHGAF